MSSSVGVVLGVVVLVLAAAVVVLVRELVLRAPAPRVQPRSAYRAVAHRPSPPGPVRWPPRTNCYGELEEP